MGSASTRMLRGIVLALSPLPVLLAVFALLTPALAAAQDGNGPAAEALFERGFSEMKANRLDVACPAFAESYRLDPRPGTLFARAECEAKWGKPASASARFADYLAAARQLPTAQQGKHRERMQI